MTTSLMVRVRLEDKARWRAQAAAEGLTLSAWTIARLNGNGIGALHAEALRAVGQVAPAEIERLAAAIVEQAVERALQDSSVTRADFEDFAAEVKAWLTQKLERQSSSARDADGYELPDY